MTKRRMLIGLLGANIQGSMSPVLFADALDVFEDGRAAAAHQLHEAEMSALGEIDDRLDRFLRFQPDVDEGEVWKPSDDRLAETIAVGEFFGVDAGAVQDERQEMPDAAVFVDHEADRHAGGFSGRGRPRFGAGG